MINDWTELCLEAVQRLDKPRLLERAHGLTGLAERDLGKRLRVAEMEASVALLTDATGLATMPASVLDVRLVMAGRDVLPQLPLEAIRARSRDGYALQGATLATTRASETLTVEHYAALPSLGPALATNWLLAADPELYLHALMRQMAMAAMDAEKAAFAEMVVARLVEERQSLDHGRRLAGAMMVTGGPTP